MKDVMFEVIETILRPSELSRQIRQAEIDAIMDGWKAAYKDYRDEE